MTSTKIKISTLTKIFILGITLIAISPLLDKNSSPAALICGSVLVLLSLLETLISNKN